MHRCFIPPDAVHGETLRLTRSDELHHLRDVLRVTVGERVAFFDGTGRAWTGEVTGLSSTALTARLVAVAAPPQSSLTITLAQAIPKHQRFDAIIEHASALGVTRIVPVLSERTIVRVTAAQAQAKRSRWERLAVAAAKQCGRSRPAEILPPGTFDDTLRLIADHQRTLVPTLAGDTLPLQRALRGTPPSSLLLFIGPEGDWSPREVEAIRARGGVPVSLGPLTLRSDLAAIAALAMIQYEYGF